MFLGKNTVPLLTPKSINGYWKTVKENGQNARGGGGGEISYNRNWDELCQFTSSGASFFLSNNQKYSLNLATFHAMLD